MFLMLLLLVACASEPPKTKQHSANSLNDLFQVEQGMPMREVKSKEFFFKHCSQGGWPFFTKTESYQCTDAGN